MAQRLVNSITRKLFYLKSRGLSELAARNLLTYAFGAEIIDRIPVASLKHRLEQSGSGANSEKLNHEYL